MVVDRIAVTRRTVIVAAGVLASGCSDGGSETNGGDNTPEESEPDSQQNEEKAGMNQLTLTSQTFEDGEQIPGQYGYEAENVNPPLEIGNVPEAAESLALIMDDPDAVEPAGKVWDHWVVWNIPPSTATIPKGWDADGATEGTNDYGEVGYGGPNPPDREHTYRFRLFALETTLDLPAETDADSLESAMEGHVIEQTLLEGTYPA